QSHQEVIYPPTNKQSIISLILGILTLLTFCSGIVMPIPLIGFVCFPSSFVLGFLALTYGAISLRKIRKHNESGHPMAWIGIVIGGFVFFCILLFVIGIASLFLFTPDTMQPLIENYSA